VTVQQQHDMEVVDVSLPAVEAELMGSLPIGSADGRSSARAAARAAAFASPTLTRNQDVVSAFRQLQRSEQLARLLFGELTHAVVAAERESDWGSAPLDAIARCMRQREASIGKPAGVVDSLALTSVTHSLAPALREAIEDATSTAVHATVRTMPPSPCAYLADMIMHGVQSASEPQAAFQSAAEAQAAFRTAERSEDAVMECMEYYMRSVGIADSRTAACWEVLKRKQLATDTAYDAHVELEELEEAAAYPETLVPRVEEGYVLEASELAWMRQQQG